MQKITQNHVRSIIRTALVATALTVGMASSAFAAGTASGTVVGNIATINYAYDGVAQTPVGSTQAGNTSGAGVATTFLVGTKINLTLVEDDTTYTAGSAGAVLQATSFTLTNLGNDSQGYNLTAANSALAVFSLADSFDVTTFAYYVDVNNDGLQDGGDTLITSVDSLAPDASINLLVTATIGGAELGGTQSTISLTAVTTTNNTTVAVVETVGAFDSTVVQIVFSDPSTAPSGTDPGQTEGDASAIALDAYRVSTTDLSVSKVTAVYSDPANGLIDPKAIPGAILTYTITIVNNGSGVASGVSIDDIVDEITTGTVSFNLQYNTATISCAANNGIVVKDGADGSASCRTNAVDGDGANFNAGTDTVSAAGLTLNPAETATLSFQVEIL
jgi:hypothetical protein